MIRKILIAAFVLTHLSGMAQEKLPIYDSLGVYLANTEQFMEGEETIYSDPDDWTMPPTPRPSTPVYCNCDSSDKETLNTCMQKEVELFIAKKFKIPRKLRKYPFRAKVYVSFVLDTTASISYIEIARGATKDLPVSIRSLGSLIDDEAIRTIRQLEFCTPAYLNSKEVKIQLMLPISVSNPGRKRLN